MKTRPMLWAPESVRALLNTRPDGTSIDPAKPFKTETRRLMNPQPAVTVRFGGGALESPEGYWMRPRGEIRTWRNTFCDGQCWRPPSLAGDHLWGREAYRATVRWDGSPPREIDQCSAIRYEATGLGPDGYDWPKDDYVFGRYRHARFMPRWVSRLRHEVLEVRPERLQELTEEGALAEGCPESPEFSARDAYSLVWDQLHEKAGWEGNPWVWVLRFRRIDA